MFLQMMHSPFRPSSFWNLPRPLSQISTLTLPTGHAEKPEDAVLSVDDEPVVHAVDIAFQDA